MWDVDSSGQEVAPPANTAAGAAGSALPNAMARMQETAMMTALLQQQAALTRRARRLHIGNLPPGLTLESMRELFNTTLSAAKLTLDEAPCINDVHMSGDARFGFVEFRSVLECTNALVLDGMQLLGRALKVQRPNDYMPPPPGLDKVLIPQSVSSVVTSSTVPTSTASLLGLHGAQLSAVGNPAVSAALTASGMPPSGSVSGLSGAALAAMSAAAVPLAAASGAAAAGVSALGSLANNNLGLTRRARRVHVGNLPLGAGLTAEMLKQFFNAAITSANLHDSSKEGDPVIDSMIGSEGKFGFIEFRTIAEATSCIALNNIELAGKQLRIERPRDYAPMPDSMLDELRAAGVLGNTSISPDGKDLLAAAAPPSAASSGGLLQLGLAAPPAAPAAAPAGPPPVDPSTATPVLVLDAMVSKEDLASAEEMGEILEDARSECSKHGAVSLYVPKPGVSGPAGSGAEEAAIALKLFAEYGTAAEALACGKELHGKQFDGRTVLASFLPPEAFQAVKGLDCFTA